VDKQTAQMLMDAAKNAMKNAYAPYSGFFVGAAVLCEDGEIFTGCNVENAAFSPSCCAERVAVYSAVAKKKRAFRGIAVAGGPGGEIRELCAPCGVCRQVLEEFCPADMPVILTDGEKTAEFTLGGLLPMSFGAKNL